VWFGISCPDGSPGVRARELDQHRRARRIVVRRRSPSVVVAVRHHHDRARRAPDRLDDEVLQLNLAAPGDDSAEAFGSDRQPIGLELLAEPARHA
jgi:hypothetical protein